MKGDLMHGVGLPGEVTEELRRIMANNSSALKELPGKTFVDVSHHVVKGHALEEGMPISWGNEPHAIAALPNRNDCPG